MGRLIDGDELVLWLSKWMTSSFGQEPTEETEAIRKVCDAVGDMVKDLAKDTGGDLIRRETAMDALDSIGSLDTEADRKYARSVFEALPSAESNADQRIQRVGSVDLISRQAAIDAVTAWVNKALNPINRSKYNEGEIAAYETALSELKKIPSAEPKTGRWVGIKEYCDHLNEEAAKKGESTRYMPSGMYIGVYCDQCWEVNERSAAYCPNCGAPMEKELDGGYYG